MRQFAIISLLPFLVPMSGCLTKAEPPTVVVTKTIVLPTVPPAYLVKPCPQTLEALRTTGDIDEARAVAEKERADCAAQVDAIAAWRVQTLEAHKPRAETPGTAPN